MAAPTVDDLVATLVELYQRAELRLARDIATSLKAGIDSPRWASEKLIALTALRMQAQRILAKLAIDSDDAVRQAIALAVQRGGRRADEEPGRLGDTPARGQGARLVRQALPGNPALVRLARELALTLRSTHVQILRWQLDAYRKVIAEAALPDVLLGLQTRRQAAQHAWERLLDRGIAGFVDRGGRRWELASYVEMAARTGTMAAAVQTHADRLIEAGDDLVIVSDSPRECPKCRPWERKVLSLSGKNRGDVQVEHATRDGEMVTVHVAGSLVEARAAGLMHPNCTHSVSRWTPGITKVGNANSNPEGYEAKQRQRAIERHIRRWKRREQAAIDPAAEKVARAKVREWQAALRQHIDEHGLKRLPYREQIGRAR
ncbi:phage minor capsid protein [Nonomuraea sediminis]|uniref:phage minor capsid protein n=1 Tax=Nonomuraea sediminis TaxID=2835864 RepID=UPI001BDD31BD|nr:phage minor capsid protein [Nonomuraea sediminis]